MAHFAEIDENNIVVRVLVIDQEEINSYRWGDPAKWVQVSYNTRRGVYYNPNTNDPAADQSKAFRKNFPSSGFLWLPDGPDGEGFVPPKVFSSWVLNPFSYIWEAPVPRPDDGKIYVWDEETISWREAPDLIVVIPEYPE